MRKTATEAILRQEVGWFDDEKNASGGLSASIASHPSQVAVATGLVSGRLVVAFVKSVNIMSDPSFLPRLTVWMSLFSL
jgi:hypothetical protein